MPKPTLVHEDARTQRIRTRSDAEREAMAEILDDLFPEDAPQGYQRPAVVRYYQDRG